MLVTLHPRLRKQCSLQLLACSPGSAAVPIQLDGSQPARIPALAVAAVAAQAVFPSVGITNVQCAGMPKQVGARLLAGDKIT